MESGGARRAARRAQVRRQRKIAAGSGFVLVALAVGAVVALAQGGGSEPRPRSAAAPAMHPAHTVHASTVRPAENVATLGAANIRRLAQLGLPIYCGGSRGNAVAFTFDDGPGPYTHYALTKLGQAHERATFFVVGRSMNYFPGWVAKELQLAAIGDHTATHPVLPSLSSAAIQTEIQSTKAKIQSTTRQPVELFRPPYGALDPAVLAIARRLGLLSILWTVDSGDSLGANWAGIIRNVEAGLHPGSIILMHENRGQTIRALTTILPELHRRHLRSVSLPELLATDPPSVTQVRRGPHGCAQPVRTSAASG
jgi:peptidoglycan/xylan/chitin deacetylase (PgdA/CDA1 family)